MKQGKRAVRRGEQQAGAACLRRPACCASLSAGRGFGRQAKLAAAMITNLQDLGFWGTPR